MTRPIALVALVVLALAALPAAAANDRFWRETPDSPNGFMPARDPLYVKECGACHTPYLPGLLPARSWELHMKRLEKHFGEIVVLKPADAEAIRRYLVENAAENSKLEGSLTVVERLDPARTPYRFMDMPLFVESHRIILEVIDRRGKVKVRKLTNCTDCHQRADQGSFGNAELYIPGLTKNRRALGGG